MDFNGYVSAHFMQLNGSTSSIDISGDDEGDAKIVTRKGYGDVFSEMKCRIYMNTKVVDLAADFKQLDSSTVSKDNFHSCVSGDDELSDVEIVTGTSIRQKSHDAGQYPSCIQASLQWKGI